MRWVGLYTLFRREVQRYVRRPKNTFMPPAITNVLYFAVFGVVLGGRIEAFGDFSYIEFILPGLIVLGTVSNAFENSSFSIFHGRWNEYIDEPLTSPLSYSEIVVAYVAASALRGLVVGLIIGAVGRLFTTVTLRNPLVLVAAMVVISVLFAGLGVIGGLVATDFDDLTVMNQFILRPLVFFGAVFYTLDTLPELWAQVSLLNPMVHMVDTVRYGMLDFTEVAPLYSLVALTVAALAVLAVDVALVKRGYGLTD